MALSVPPASLAGSVHQSFRSARRSCDDAITKVKRGCRAVTTITGAIGRQATPWKHSINGLPDLASSAAVGSSQTSSLGVVNQGAGDGHALLAAPDSCAGRT